MGYNIFEYKNSLWNCKCFNIKLYMLYIIEHAPFAFNFKMK